MPREIHVAVGEIVIRESLEEGLSACLRVVSAAASMGVEAIFFGEVALSGYHYALTPGFVQERVQSVDGPLISTLREQAERSRIRIGIGFWEAAGDEIYNSYALIAGDGTFEVVRKYNLTELELDAGVKQGPIDGRVFEWNGIRVGLAICADVGAPELVQHLHDQSIELMLLPTGGGTVEPGLLKEIDLDTQPGMDRYKADRKRLWQRQPVVHHSDWPCNALIATNALGPVSDPVAGESYHWGQSQIIDSGGVLRAQIPGTTVREHMQDAFAHTRLSF